MNKETLKREICTCVACARFYLNNANTRFGMARSGKSIATGYVRKARILNHELIRAKHDRQ